MYWETQLQKSKADISHMKEYCKIYKELTAQQTTRLPYDEIFCCKSNRLQAEVCWTGSAFSG